MMKAIKAFRSENASTPSLQLMEVPIPHISSGYALVKVYYSCITPSDKVNANGKFPYTTYPRILGRDFSGVIVDGPHNRLGEEVYGTGGSELGFTLNGPHADYCLLPESDLVRKPSTLSFVQAATVGLPFTTALSALKRARAAKNDIVLVLGAKGAVGSAAVEISKAIGVKKVLSAYRGGGADVDITSGMDCQALASSTGGKGADVIVDTVGNLDLMKSGIDQLAVKGRYTWITSPGVNTEISFNILQAYRKEIELIGISSAGYTFHEVLADLEQLRGWFESGAIRAKAEEEYEIVPLDCAIEKGYQKKGRGKVVISLL